MFSFNYPQLDIVMHFFPCQSYTGEGPRRLELSIKNFILQFELELPSLFGMWSTIQFLLYPLLFQILNSSSFQSEGTNTTYYKSLGLSENSPDNFEEYVNLTEMEKNQIHRLRQIMGDKLELDFEKCDDFLIRWLQECDMDLTCASEMLRNTLQWRRSALAEIMKPNKTFLTSREDPTHSLNGQTKDSVPILVYALDGWDVRKLVLSGKKENLINHHIQLTERHFQACIRRKENGEVRLTSGVVLGNIHGMSLKIHACPGCMGFYRDLSNVGDQHYPRLYKYIVIYNAPPWSKPFFQSIRSFLSPYFQKVIKIFGRQKEELNLFLHNHVTNEELLDDFA